MKAVVLDSFGSADSVRMAKVDDPIPQTGEALVKIEACALNHLDLWVARGHPAYSISLPHILGCDMAGTIESFGANTKDSGFKKGDAVVVSPGVSCWSCPRCLEGHDNLCVDYGILGADGGRGGLAEFAVVPVRNLVYKPENLSFPEAASYPLTFLTSYHMLAGLAQLRAGQNLIVTGAGSGVGTAAIQIARHLGAKILAVSSSQEKLARALSLGAHDAALCPPERLSKICKKIFGRNGADVVFEHIGGEMFLEALRCLRPGGALVTCGATAEPTVSVDLRHVFFKELRLLGAKMGTLEELKILTALFAQGKLRPAVDEIFPLERAAEAFRRLMERRQFGKVIVVP